MANFKWMKNINNLADLLEGDAKIICQKCGPDVLIALLETFNGMFFYISSKSITSAQRQYILSNYNGHNANELASTVGRSTRYIYKVLKENKNKKNTSSTNPTQNYKRSPK